MRAWLGGLLTLRKEICSLGRAQPPLLIALLFLSWSFGQQRMNLRLLPWRARLSPASLPHWQWERDGGCRAQSRGSGSRWDENAPYVDAATSGCHRSDGVRRVPTCRSAQHRIEMGGSRGSQRWGITGGHPMWGGLVWMSEPKKGEEGPDGEVTQQGVWGSRQRLRVWRGTLQRRRWNGREISYLQEDRSNKQIC